MDWMAQTKAVLPSALVLSGEAPQERMEETVLSDAARAAYISGVVPFLVFDCEETLMMMMMMIHTNNYHVDSCDNGNYEDGDHVDDDHDNQWCRPIPSVWLQGDIDDNFGEW